MRPAYATAFKVFSLFLCAVFALSQARSQTENTIVFGTSFRLAEKSRDLSNHLMNSFCNATKLRCEMRFLPQERLNRDFSLGLIDILLFRDHIVDDRWRQTAYPFAATSLYAIHYSKPTNAQPTFIEGGINPNATIAWQRGDNLEDTLNFHGKVVEIEGFEQGLQLVKAGRISAYFEWNTEILIRTSFEAIIDRGFIITPIIEDIPLYPMRNEEAKNAAVIDQLSQWYQAMHDKGELLPIYESYGLSDAYPFHKNWQKWLAK